MSMNNDYLIHYGIKGQKWGVRRFQNEDGSLTKAGRERYRTTNKRFSDAERYVKGKMTNRLEKIVKQPIDISEVKKRGNLNTNEALQCIELAKKIYVRLHKKEPAITKDVISSSKESLCTMYGLEYRMKQPTSIASKIGSDAKEKNISFEDASKEIKDVIRYTSISDDEKFVKSYLLMKQHLLEKGYSEITCKNFFQMYKDGLVKHKSVQSIYEDDSGCRFELQFHTPSSQAAKNLKIPLYEERRKRGISSVRKRELEKQMTDLAEYVSYPENVMDIVSH